MSMEDGRFSTVIRAELRDEFFKLDNKGEIVNDLLQDYFKLGVKPERKSTIPKRVDPALCEHGAGKGLCKVARCKNWY